MARSSPVFVCSECGGETLKWQGQCPHCSAWNSLEQRAASARPAAAAPRNAPRVLDEQLTRPESRLGTGQAELDRVLGGGIVPGSVTLLGGDPGIGKSTLLLQVAAHAAGSQRVLYASGEESEAQVGGRARRLSVSADHLSVVTENDLEPILALAAERKVSLLVVDSIQTVSLASVTTSPGAVGQLRECTAALVRFAKSTGTAVMLIGHVTKRAPSQGRVCWSTSSIRFCTSRARLAVGFASFARPRTALVR